ncbi:molybdate transport system substrate-binding protein [Rhizobium sp. ERR 922]|uniref:molybdate ABC transporter substrate-binding protein n=1 Tax=unclassified Rhizobium TaxID=2613769 RepID=UPI000DDF3E70|nr:MULTISPECIES: molybdate ABC transporter substrate-binding protein [unclassified Rhizobium]TWB10943.1 molybdate transport system substrate-binding protein [Rhizobium sp. ERR1071]TWB48607.1 molybdate transport system substrate-binding protein [Rhizobium sp. ERR 922]TWB90328.1 molybdate transport system substrate-binding protein [Rhizobium sp. ERR 942]
MSNAVHVLAAGSLRHAFPAIIDAFGREFGIGISLTLGPAGLLRQTIEAGTRFDLFASANMAHPLRLALIGFVEGAICFARNRLCVLARADLGLTTQNFLTVLADPAVRIGTSTPGDDPGGDYAFEVFDKIEARYPGKGAAIRSRSRQLVGGRHSLPTPAGKRGGYLITDGVVDLMMSYSSNARLLAGDPAFSVIDIPDEFQPLIEYGMAIRKGADDETRSLQDFLLSETGQEILNKAGFSPVD